MADKDKFADEVMSDEELEQVTGSIGGKMFESFGRGRRNDETPYGTAGK